MDDLTDIIRCVILIRQSNEAEKQTQLDKADKQTGEKQTNRQTNGQTTDKTRKINKQTKRKSNR